jgi:phage FluMu gp28-like protein
MAAILPALNIDSDVQASKYFMPYQMTWILDDAKMRLAEKSVRIGWTYGDAFKNVRKRLRFPKRDYLFASKDWPTAVEYVQTCKQFCEVYDWTRAIVSQGIEDITVPVFDENGKDTGFTEEVKMGMIKFDNGSRIIAFSSNANAMQAYGGDVGLDEFSQHKMARKCFQTGQGRVTWGYDMGIWARHNGFDSFFYELAQLAKNGKWPGTHYRVTVEDAVELGLVEKINAVMGGSQSREQFLADCRKRAIYEEVYQEEYMCNPQGGTNPITSWSAIQRCQLDYQIERVHIEAAQIEAIAGKYDRATAQNRARRIAEFIRQAFRNTLATPARYKLGFDVAASGNGDLASIYIDQAEHDLLTLRALFTCRVGDDWPFLKAALYGFLDNLSDVHGCGDETGLGRQICREAALDFPGQFDCVNFKSEKSDMGTTLMNQLSAAEKRFPVNQPDIAHDYFAMQKTFTGQRWVFHETKNQLNANSHCDIAWSGGLSSKAARQAVNDYRISLIGGEA